MPSTSDSDSFPPSTTPEPRAQSPFRIDGKQRYLAPPPRPAPPPDPKATPETKAYQALCSHLEKRRNQLVKRFNNDFFGNHMKDDVKECADLALWRTILRHAAKNGSPPENPTEWVKQLEWPASKLMKKAVLAHVAKFRRQIPIPLRTVERYRFMQRQSETLEPNLAYINYEVIQKMPEPERSILLAVTPEPDSALIPARKLTPNEFRKIATLDAKHEVSLDAPMESGADHEPGESWAHTVEDPATPPAESLPIKEGYGRLLAYLNQLTAEQRDTVARRFGLPPYDGPQKLTDIARARGVAPQSVDNCLKRAFNKLNKLFKEDDAPVVAAPDPTPTGPAKQSPGASEKPSKSPKATTPRDKKRPQA